MVDRYLNGKVDLSQWQNLGVEGLWYWTYHFTRQHLFREICPQFPAATPEIGFLTMRALQYLLDDPIRVFQMPTEQMEEYFASGRWRRDVHINWFLRQERLRDDLYSLMLHQLGYRKKVLDTALHFVPARPNASKSDVKKRLQRELSQNEALREEILRSERIYHKYILPLTQTQGVAQVI